MAKMLRSSHETLKCKIHIDICMEQAWIHGTRIGIYTNARYYEFVAGCLWIQPLKDLTSWSSSFWLGNIVNLVDFPFNYNPSTSRAWRLINYTSDLQRFPLRRLGLPLEFCKVWRWSFSSMLLPRGDTYSKLWTLFHLWTKSRNYWLRMNLSFIQPKSLVVICSL